MEYRLFSEGKVFQLNMKENRFLILIFYVGLRNDLRAFSWLREGGLGREGGNGWFNYGKKMWERFFYLKTTQWSLKAFHVPSLTSFSTPNPISSFPEELQEIIHTYFASPAKPKHQNRQFLESKGTPTQFKPKQTFKKFDLERRNVVFNQNKPLTLPGKENESQTNTSRVVRWTQSDNSISSCKRGAVKLEIKLCPRLDSTWSLND